jgi:glycerol-3-phosphate acyltransferase PlsY
VLGPRWGALVFVLDALKGYLATLIAHGLAPVPPSFPPPMVAALTGGLAAILGHVFTPWLRFRGGRGVATSLGVFLGIAPIPTLIAFAIWILLVRISRRVSVGSIVAAAAYPFLVFELAPQGANRGVLTAVAAAVGLLVLARHLPNIRRLLNGTEPPIFGATSKEGRP